MFWEKKISSQSRLKYFFCFKFCGCLLSALSFILVILIFAMSSFFHPPKKCFLHFYQFLFKKIKFFDKNKFISEDKRRGGQKWVKLCLAFLWQIVQVIFGEAKNHSNHFGGLWVVVRSNSKSPTHRGKK